MSFFYFGEKVVEPVQLWLKKVYFYIVENPTGSCFAVILLIILVLLAVYRIQLISNSNLCPRRRDQRYYGPTKNHGYLQSRQQTSVGYPNDHCYQRYSIKSQGYSYQREMVEPIHPVRNYGYSQSTQQTSIGYPNDHHYQRYSTKSQGYSYQTEVVRPIHPQIGGTIHPSGIKKRQKKTTTDFPHPNVAFYSNQVVSKPDGDYIDNILNSWKGNYYKLEKHHGFIQWLFPIPEMGMNPLAHPLTKEEEETIRTTPELKERVKRSFEMMLDFYGMELRMDNMFVLADNGTERLQELNQWGNHNFLRISRILLALKLLGHSDLMLPWMKFLFNLIHVEKVLDQAAASFENYWIKKLDKKDVTELKNYMKPAE